MNYLQTRKENLAITALLFTFMVVVMPGLPGVLDMPFWRDWSLHIHHHGLSEAYGSGTNYPPLYQYFLWLYATVAGSPEVIDANLRYVRIPTLLVELCGIWLVYKWTDKRPSYVFLLAATLLNIAYAYNTMIWCQTDAILAALAFAALYEVHRERPIRSAVWMVLALNMKLQAIVFLPLWGLLMLGSIHRTRLWRQVPAILLAMAAIQALVILPFAFGEGGVGKVWQAVAGLHDTYPDISLNAFNMWYWVTADAKIGHPDNVVSLFGWTYHSLGLAAFTIAMAIVLWPVIRHTVLTLAGRSSEPISRRVVWLAAALSVLSFFFFNTRMHERYYHPAFIFVVAYACYTRRWEAYVLFSMAAFLNIERVGTWLRLPNYDTFVFDPRFVAALWALLIAGLTVRLYQAAGKRRRAGQPHAEAAARDEESSTAAVSSS